MNTEDLLPDFVEEAKAHVEKIENAFLDIDIDSLRKNKELINNVFRAIHSIKGTAGFFKLKVIVSLSHAMENMLGKIRADNIILTGDVIDCLLVCNDVLKNMLFNVGTCEKTDITDCLIQLETILNQGNKPVNKVEGERVTPIVKHQEPRLESILDIDEKFHYLLEKSVKKGHKIFKIVIPYEDSIPEHIKNLDKFIENIREIGKIIDIF